MIETLTFVILLLTVVLAAFLGARHLLNTEDDLKYWQDRTTDLLAKVAEIEQEKEELAVAARIAKNEKREIENRVQKLIKEYQSLKSEVE